MNFCTALTVSSIAAFISRAMVTGSTGPEDEIRGLELGAQDYIRKPLNKEALLFRVRKALGEHRSQLGAA